MPARSVPGVTPLGWGGRGTRLINPVLPHRTWFPWGTYVSRAPPPDLWGAAALAERALRDALDTRPSGTNLAFPGEDICILSTLAVVTECA